MAPLLPNRFYNGVQFILTTLQPMFKNYFKIALRNLFNSKNFSALNIIGLSIGMTCCLLIFQYVTFESSFDEFHVNKDKMYRVLQAYVRGSEEVMGTGHAYTAQA